MDIDHNISLHNSGIPLLTTFLNISPDILSKRIASLKYLLFKPAAMFIPISTTLEITVPMAAPITPSLGNPKFPKIKI